MKRLDYLRQSLECGFTKEEVLGPVRAEKLVTARNPEAAVRQEAQPEQGPARDGLPTVLR